MSFERVLPFILVIIFWILCDLLYANFFCICRRKRYKCRNHKCKKWVTCEYAKIKPDVVKEKEIVLQEQTLDNADIIG